MAQEGMQVQSVARENGPERLVTETEVLFDDGPLARSKLVGFSLWKSVANTANAEETIRSLPQGLDYPAPDGSEIRLCAAAVPSRTALSPPTPFRRPPATGRSRNSGTCSRARV